MAAITEETRQRIIELYEAGETNKTEIARQSGTSRPTVNKVLREASLWKPESDAEAVEETCAGDNENAHSGGYENGEADEEHETLVYSGLTDGEERQVRELYEQQREESLEQVAEELGLEPEAVRAAVEAYDEGDEEGYEEPAPIVLGSPSSAFVGLMAGVILGAAGLYYATMRGPNDPPGEERAGR